MFQRNCFGHMLFWVSSPGKFWRGVGGPAEASVYEQTGGGRVQTDQGGESGGEEDDRNKAVITVRADPVFEGGSDWAQAETRECRQTEGNCYEGCVPWCFVVVCESESE